MPKLFDFKPEAFQKLAGGNTAGTGPMYASHPGGVPASTPFRRPSGVGIALSGEPAVLPPANFLRTLRVRPEAESIFGNYRTVGGRALAMVLEWAVKHQTELAAAWETLQAGGEPEKIDPLDRR